MIQLKFYSPSGFRRGASRVKEFCWIAVSGLFFESWFPGSIWRIWLLQIFGAHIGKGVVIKPRVRVKFPWKLTVDDYTWIGEGAWIDNLGDVEIGSNVCLSQGVYLCTGSHDWSSGSFELIIKPIRIQNFAWICAGGTVGPGVIVGEGAVLGLASCTSKSLNAWTIYLGAPAMRVRSRNLICEENLLVQKNS